MYISENADHQNSSWVFGPAVHEHFEGILLIQLKGPYGLKQLLIVTAEYTWCSQLKALFAVLLL